MKKTAAEVEHLVTLMLDFGKAPPLEELPPSGRRRNAYKKIIALRERRAPLFWALGPDGCSMVYRTRFKPNEAVELVPVQPEALRFPSS